MQDEDVTQKILDELAHAPGELAKAARRAAPAREITGTLAKTLLDMLDPRFDPTMGFISMPILYSSLFRHMPRNKHLNIIRLLKGGHLALYQRYGNKPINSRCEDETTHTPVWYELRLRSES